MANYSKKICKREKPPTENYLIVQTKPRNDRVPISFKWSDDYYQIVSIDPGIVDFAFRIERRYKNGKIKTLVIDVESFDVTPDKSDMTYYFPISVELFLDKYRKYYKDTHFFIVERQLYVSHRTSLAAHQSLVYFMNYCRKHSSKNRYIIDLNSKMKTNALNAPAGMNQVWTKKWGVAKAKELLKLRKDRKGLSEVAKYESTAVSKLNDVTDTIIQIEAFFASIGLPLTPGHVIGKKTRQKRAYNPFEDPEVDYYDISSSDKSDSSSSDGKRKKKNKKKSVKRDSDLIILSD